MTIFLFIFFTFYSTADGADDSSLAGSQTSPTKTAHAGSTAPLSPTQATAGAKKGNNSGDAAGKMGGKEVSGKKPLTVPVGPSMMNGDSTRPEVPKFPTPEMVKSLSSYL